MTHDEALAELAKIRAYFVDGLNIALADTLVGVAEKAGLPKDETREILDSRRFKDASHIGLEDRAKAVQNLPTDPKWLQMRCISGVPEGHLQSSDDTGCHSDAAGSGDTSPCDVSPSVTHRQKKAPPVTDGAKWRRRESKRPRKTRGKREFLTKAAQNAAHWTREKPIFPPVWRRWLKLGPRCRKPSEPASWR